MEITDILDEKEFKVINTIFQNKINTQRDISKKAGISLGITNLIIKRLIKKGFLKIRRINKRRILYYLTPKALLQRSVRTYNYIERTIKDVIEIKKKIQDMVLHKINNNYDRVDIIGNNEIAEIARWAVNDIGYLNKKKNNGNEKTLFINCENEKIDRDDYLNIFDII